MARRTSSAPEISLFPFLSILVCVIGSLVLLIVIMTLAQSNSSAGRTPEEMKRAKEFQTLTHQMEKTQEEIKKLETESGAAGKLLAELEKKKAQLLSLKKDLQKLSPEKDPKQTDAELQKRLELAMEQIAAMDKEKPSLVKELAKLEADLAAQKKKLEAPPALIVQPGGSGNAKGATLYFIEAGGGGVSIHEKGKDPVRISNGSIPTDEGLNKFFLQAQKDPKAMVLFLIRDDGNGSYNLAAGLAENTFKLRTGKLPLPGRGAVDLSKFGFPKK